MTLGASAYVARRIEMMSKPIELDSFIPNLKLLCYKNGNTRSSLYTYDTLSKGRVMLFTVPKIFTDSSSDDYAQKFVELAEKIKEFGVTTIACTSVNTCDEAKLWQSCFDPKEQIKMIPDWGGDFIYNLGLGVDESAKGFGFVAKRSCILIEAGRVKWIRIEKDLNDYGICSPEMCLEYLKRAAHLSKQSNA